jgi:hypothetical protein
VGAVAANLEQPERATTDQQETIIQQMAALVSQMAATAGMRAQDFLTLTNGSAAIACLAMIGQLYGRNVSIGAASLLAFALGSTGAIVWLLTASPCSSS